MVAVAEKMYDLEDGVLKLTMLRSASAWGSLSAISTESERRSGQSGTAVLLSDSAASEAEVPLRRIAQVFVLDRGGTGMSGGVRRQLNQWQAGDARKLSQRW